MNIEIGHILVDDSFNCRGGFTPTSVQELAASMEAEGLINPVCVMINPRHSGPPYMLIAGHRRIAAAKLLDWETIEAIQWSDITERQAHKVNLQENLGRRDLRPSHEMRAIVAIYGDKPDRAQVAKELGKSRKWVNDRLRLREFDKCILDKVDEGLLGALDLQYLAAALPGERWNMAEMLMEQKAAGVSSKEVARRLRLRRKPRGIREMRGATDYILDHARTPSWSATLDWCGGQLSSEEFFEDSLASLKEYGILE